MNFYNLICTQIRTLAFQILSDFGLLKISAHLQPTAVNGSVSRFQAHYYIFRTDCHVFGSHLGHGNKKTNSRPPSMFVIHQNAPDQRRKNNAKNPQLTNWQPESSLFFFCSRTELPYLGDHWGSHGYHNLRPYLNINQISSFTGCFDSLTLEGYLRQLPTHQWLKDFEGTNEAKTDGTPGNPLIKDFYELQAHQRWNFLKECLEGKLF